MPSLIVLSAPSGTGKSTVLAQVLASVPKLRFSVSHTTRAPRPGESDGVQYHFVDRPEFERMIAADALLEFAEVHGQLYGTSRAEYQKACDEDSDLLLDIDVQGAAQLRTRFSGSVSIFLLPPSFQDLERRLRGRAQDSDASIRRRLDNARREVERCFEYDYLAINSTVEACVLAVQSVVRAARQRRTQLEPAARKVLATFQS